MRLLYQERPLVNALVMALDAIDAQTPQQVRSDALGRATFTLPRAGRRRRGLGELLGVADVLAAAGGASSAMIGAP